MNDDLVILYDGECALCSGAVRFLLRRDRARRLRFAPLGGTTAAGVIARHPAIAGLDTLVFVDGPRDLVLVRSDAVLAACATLGGAWGALASVARVLPRDARDAGYRLIARLRHRTTAGRACPAIPTEWLDRLLG